MSYLSYYTASLALAFCLASMSVNGQQAPAIPNMYQRAETGWIERYVYRSAADAKVSVEISDVLVGPGRVALLKEMITGALVEVKAGVAMVTVDQKKQRIAPGVVLRVDQGQTLSIDNRRGKRPFVARLIRISLPH